jgi:hypothetical protein
MAVRSCRPNWSCLDLVDVTAGAANAVAWRKRQQMSVTLATVTRQRDNKRTDDSLQNAYCW